MTQDEFQGARICVESIRKCNKLVFAGSSRHFAYKKPSSSSSGFTFAAPTDPEHGSRPRLRSQRSPSTVIGAEVDALGNAGITTFLPGAGPNELLWWGEYHAGERRRVV